MSWSPGKMKLSRAAQCGGGGSGGRGTLLSSELRDRDRQGCRGHKRDTEGTGGEAQSTSEWRHREVAGMPKERPGLRQTRSGMQIHTEVPRDPTAHTCRDTRRDTRGSPPSHTPHFTRSAVTHSSRGGDNPGARWQAGHYLPLRTGVPYLPHLGSACLLLTSAPRLPENRAADGTWGAQVAGAGQCCELSCCCGGRGSCPPGGQKPEPPRGYKEQAWAG